MAGLQAVTTELKVSAVDRRRLHEIHAASILSAAIAFGFLLLGGLAVVFALVTGRTLELTARFALILALWTFLASGLMALNRLIGAGLGMASGAAVVVLAVFIAQAGNGDAFAIVVFPSVMVLSGTMLLAIGVRRVLGGSREVSVYEIASVVGVVLLTLLVARI
jgi:hypothetical protein